MMSDRNNFVGIFLKGMAYGFLVAAIFAVIVLFHFKNPHFLPQIKKIIRSFMVVQSFTPGMITEHFNEPLAAQTGQRFGKRDQLTFELFRDGTFIIDGDSKYAWQKSRSYRDSAFIRSSLKLPRTYKISIVVGEIDYGLEKIRGLPRDSEYPEGPQNENGCYLIAITDEKPQGHHTNVWWHQHRKVAIDVDNNVWGHGMPNPIFMVYFDRLNQMLSYNGQLEQWVPRWEKAIAYNPSSWYRVEIEKTSKFYIMSILEREGQLLSRAKVALENVWREDGQHDEYFVVGDPHENYYQGSMKIDSISFTPGRD